MLSFLKRNKISATFFILGSQVNQKVLKRIVKEGHVVGSHSWDHPSFPQLSEWDMKWQLHSTEDAIYKACRRRPKLFRPPYGDVDWRVSSLVNGEGYEIVNWNIDSNDWHGDSWAAQSAITGGLGAAWKSFVADQRRRRRGGYIILQHDAYFQEHVGEATVKAALKKGLRFVTLAECLGVDAYKNQREVDKETTSTSTSTRRTSTTTTVTSKLASTTIVSTATKVIEQISAFTMASPSEASSTLQSTSTTPHITIPSPTPLATLVIAQPLPPAVHPEYEPTAMVRVIGGRRP